MGKPLKINTIPAHVFQRVRVLVKRVMCHGIVDPTLQMATDATRRNHFSSIFQFFFIRI